jgi:hypothetical protein
VELNALSDKRRNEAMRQQGKISNDPNEHRYAPSDALEEYVVATGTIGERG